MDLVCWAGLPSSHIFLGLIRRRTSNPIFGNSPYESMELLGQIQVPSSYDFSNKQTHEIPTLYVPRVAVPSART